MKKTIISALAIAAMVGCAKEEVYTPENSSVAKFSSSEIETRVSADGTKWGSREEIGITMFNLSDDATPVETIADDSDNIKYVSTNDVESASVTFEVVTTGEELLYPNSGKVRFYAYYPYQSSMVDGSYIYTADVSDQSDDIDFMVATPVDASRTSTPQELNFSHKLSKLTLSITGRETADDITNVTASVTGLCTFGEYSILTGEPRGIMSGNTTPIAFVMDNDEADKATATAIILPETLDADATVTFTLSEGVNTRTFTVKIPSGVEFEAGKNHTYTVALGNGMPEFISGSTIKCWEDSTEDELFSKED